MRSDDPRSIERGRGLAAALAASTILLVAIVVCAESGWAQEPESAASRPASRRSNRATLREIALTHWDVRGVRREARIHLPGEKRWGPSPVVFAFHGHGGSAQQAADSFQFHTLWPEAIVVYPDGLPTPLGVVDPEGRHSGWQTFAGDQGDRDLAFFDEMLVTLKRDYRIDEDRVYAMGHSNGGTFTYLLWHKRPAVFAAFAPSSSGSWSVLFLQPKPALLVAGEKDELVPIAGQRRTMSVVRRRNGCQGDPQPWGPHCLLYPSEKGAPFVSLIHPGGHKYPIDATTAIVRFFAEHPRKPAAPESRR